MTINEKTGNEEQVKDGKVRSLLSLVPFPSYHSGRTTRLCEHRTEASQYAVAHIDDKCEAQQAQSLELGVGGARF